MGSGRGGLEPGMSVPDDFSPTYTAPMDVETYRLLGLDEPGPWAVNGHDRYDGGLAAMTGEFDRAYHPCPEASPAGDVPAGALTSIRGWASDTHYPGTKRDIRCYTTHGMQAEQDDVSLIVLNDGHFYLGRNGPVRASQVFDSLFASDDIGPTLAVFISPGLPDGLPQPLVSQADRNAADDQRSIEYDSLRPDYVQFLIEEVIPLAESTMACRATKDPARRMAVGMSSGGIAAFTAAWHAPDEFGRVLSHCGSFTNIKGGHNYPWMIRNTPRKPVRVFMTSGENDINGMFGNWPLANQQVASALDFAGYDYHFEFGAGGHTLAHGGALFADSLRWLLR